MDKEEIKRRINSRIDEDDEYASNIKTALDTGDDAFLLALIAAVIGVIIEIGSNIWSWVKGQFS